MARIRTIKPEFWTHHIMGRATDSQKCMALALLNHADDEGYFLADPAIVRSVCRPFDEESLTSHGLITDLSLLGWIELCKSDDGVMLGRIVKFKQNQIINRPKKSKLKESWSDHGLITDESLTHHVGKGKERNREQGKEEKILSVSQAKADPIPYDSIIESANQILGKKFRATEKHKSIIRARWNEGFREDDFATVCSTMQVVWGSDQKMQAYLRPETLFGTKMDGYLNTAPVESRELSRSEQWRKEAQSEVNAFVYGGRNDQDNGQHTGQAAIC